MEREGGKRKTKVLNDLMDECRKAKEESEEKL